MGIVVSTFLLVHSLHILAHHDRALSIHPYMDMFFEILLLVRVTFAIPRPYLWIETWRKFARARQQPTPQLVGDALNRIYRNPNQLERFLLYFYYTWLFISSAVSLFTPYRTELGQRVWTHLLLNFACIIVHRMACISIFYYLLNSDMERGVHKSVIEKESKVFKFSTLSDSIDAECSICFADYDRDDEVRVLKCGHDYHKSCVDEWLMRHRNRCPKCMSVIGAFTRLHTD